MKKRVIKGSQSAIYRKYLKFLHEFLVQGAKHDLDHDGKKWCHKDEWNAFLCPKISNDDANAIAHGYCGSNATTAIEMDKLIGQGKKYICHRLYNMKFVKLERRKEGRNVVWFRLLQEGEEATPPVPDSIYLMKKMFVEKGQKDIMDGVVYKLSADDACEEFGTYLDPKKFADETSKVEEWGRVISILQKQKKVEGRVIPPVLKFRAGFYEFQVKK